LAPHPDLTGFRGRESTSLDVHAERAPGDLHWVAFVNRGSEDAMRMRMRMRMALRVANQCVAAEVPGGSEIRQLPHSYIGAFRQAGGQGQ
jgi:hypothetical protein